ncbi:hypothetical protein SAMN04489832_5111 [Micromonospora cremea]|uniref:Uncharacterized protein n=1 Tax=Micromonospora cremea TaxID=709881 RepID=A0A1N6A8P5_9ACTN|nr:hypothetical protein SAMN04489832_5111 [Micromonospora cremea]
MVGVLVLFAFFVRHHNPMIDRSEGGRQGGARQGGAEQRGCGRAQAAARISSPMTVSWSAPTSTAAM